MEQKFGARFYAPSTNLGEEWAPRSPDLNLLHMYMILGYNSTLSCARSKSKVTFENYMKIAFHFMIPWTNE